MTTKLHLGFHYHVAAVYKENQVFMPAYLGLFIDSIAPHFENITCFMHTPLNHELLYMDYPLKSSNIKYINLGKHNSIPSRTISNFFNRGVFRRAQSDIDVMLIRVSTPLLPIINLVWKKTLVLYIVSDASKGIENLPQPQWRKKIISIWANWYQNQEMMVAKRALACTNSGAIYNALPASIKNKQLIRTTTLSNNDFYTREDTCTGNEIRLLYAGRITKVKGLLEIVESIGELVKIGYNLHFDLVGMIDQNDPILSEIQAILKLHNLTSRFVFHGYKTAGSELLHYYRKADIFIIASQGSSEGFPRSIWEAMASGLPVIATRVSSIPQYIEGAAVLVEPKNQTQLVNAIRQVIEDKLLRQQIIKAGYLLAKENTLEQRALELANAIYAFKKSEI